MIQQTSLSAYTEIKPYKGKQEQLIYDTIKENEILNDREIAEISGVEKSSVCGRRNMLVKKGYIQISYIARDENTGKKTMYWECVK